MGEERKNSLLDSPLYDFVKRGWVKWSQKIISVQATDEDFLLFLVWALDSIKAQEDGINKKFRDHIFANLRINFIKKQFRSEKEDVEFLTNLVCAASLACFGLTLTDNLRNRDVYSEIVTGFGESWSEIQKLKYGVEMDTKSPELRAWLVDYMASDQFYTYENTIEWDNEDMAAQIIRRNKDFDKVDLFRVIMALYEIGAFEPAEGQLSKKKVFQAFGEMLGENFNDFSNHLSAGSVAYKESIDIFQRLEAGLEKYESSKDKKLTKQGKTKRRV